MSERQVKSRKRVADHGEVFTAQREVNAMLDLVKQETERIDSRFLEPACGDGNFLAEILRRKLEAAERMSHHTRVNRKTLVRTTLKSIDTALYEKNAFIAVTSLYGVDILQDNVEACRERLFSLWDGTVSEVCGLGDRDELCAAIRFVLAHNILCGNALTLKKVDADGQDLAEPIIFSEWVFTGEQSVRRSDYRLDVLMNENPDQSQYHQKTALFDTETAVEWQIDPDSGKKLPKPIREFRPVYYWKVHEQTSR